MPVLARHLLSWLSVVVTGLCATTARAADPVADFYAGKTLRIVIGYGPGGGYDIYGRIFAEHFGRFVPGQPAVIAQNMAGAGSFLAAKYLYGVAPRDGTAFGSLAQTLPLDWATTPEHRDLDASRMPYIGRMTDNVEIGTGLPGASFRSIEDARTREIVVGATGSATPAVLLPTALNLYGGTKFKIVSGYKGSNEVLVAAERKEVEVIGAIGLATTLVRNPEWILQRTAPILYQLALKRHELLPHVPALPELGLSDDGRAVLNAIASSAEIGRSIITTPDVPPERLAALRKAFMAMMSDPEFKSTMAKRNVLLAPLPGEAVDQISRAALSTPKEVLTRVQALSAAAK